MDCSVLSGKEYYVIKVLELLLYLDALSISDSVEERPYFYKSQILHQRRGALQRLGTLGVTENPGHPGAWAAVDDDRLSHRRVDGGGTEYAVLTEDAI